jgi:hypothetical protein
MQRKPAIVISHPHLVLRRRTAYDALHCYQLICSWPRHSLEIQNVMMVMTEVGTSESCGVYALQAWQQTWLRKRE